MLNSYVLCYGVIHNNQIFMVVTTEATECTSEPITSYSVSRFISHTVFRDCSTWRANYSEAVVVAVKIRCVS